MLLVPVVIQRLPGTPGSITRLQEATAATLPVDGWLKTGDAGYLDGEAYMFLHDRVRDMIVSGARRSRRSSFPPQAAAPPSRN